MKGVPGFWQLDTGDEAYVFRDGNFQLQTSILYPAPGEVPYFGKVYGVDEASDGTLEARGLGVLLYPLVFAREDPDQYQMACLATLRPDVDVEMMCVVGLAGEVGEIAEPVKKARFHGKAFDLLEIRKEIGDVLWYLAVLAKHYGVPLSSIMTENLEKLRRRQALREAVDVDRQSGDNVAVAADDGLPELSTRSIVGEAAQPEDLSEGKDEGDPRDGSPQSSSHPPPAGDAPDTSDHEDA